MKKLILGIVIGLLFTACGGDGWETADTTCELDRYFDITNECKQPIDAGLLLEFQEISVAQAIMAAGTTVTLRLLVEVLDDSYHELDSKNILLKGLDGRTVKVTTVSDGGGPISSDPIYITADSPKTLILSFQYENLCLFSPVILWKLEIGGKIVEFNCESCKPQESTGTEQPPQDEPTQCENDTDCKQEEYCNMSGLELSKDCKPVHYCVINDGSYLKTCTSNEDCLRQQYCNLSRIIIVNSEETYRCANRDNCSATDPTCEDGWQCCIKEEFCVTNNEYDDDFCNSTEPSGKECTTNEHCLSTEYCDLDNPVVVVDVTKYYCRERAVCTQ